MPVVSRDVGGVREAVIDGETGFVIAARDVEALGNALQQLLSDPLLRDQMGKAGRERFSKNFGKDQMLTKTARVYTDLVGATASAPLAALAEPE